MEDDKIFLPNGMEASVAQYHDYYIEEYDNNPYIQALPPLYNKATIIKKLSVEANFNIKERELDNTVRLHLIQRLYKFYQPLPIHLEIWNIISTLIRQGYLARNPFNKEYVKYQHATGKAIVSRTYELSTQSNFRTTASTGVIIGYSGMGKTTTVNRVLSHMPQVIVHNIYKEQEFSRIQLTWLKLEAPHNASIKALCLQYFMKIDELLGTDNFKLYVSQRLSTDSLLPLMGKVGQNVGLGLLIIDELQHLIGSNLEKIMNYFVTLINSFGIPVLFIGTPAAYPVFENEFRIARRITGHGEVIWNNMQKDDTFIFFLESIWKYQWIQQFTPLNKELIDVFYEETQGISDLVVKLFVSVQHYAIDNGGEKITTALIRKVAKQIFRAMQDMLSAIKSKNPYKLAKYQDIKVVNTTSTQDKEENIIIKKESDIFVRREGNCITKDKVVSSKKKKIIYDEEDIRSLVEKVKEKKISAHELLIANELIDDMSLWEV